MPHFFRTPDGVHIDLRLLDIHIVNQIQPELVRMLANGPERKSQLSKLRQLLIAEYRQSGVSQEQIKSLTSEKLEEEYLKLVCRDILENGKLETVAGGIGKTICELIRAKAVMDGARRAYEKDLAEHMELFEADLKANYRVRALVGKWLDEQMKEERERFEMINRFTLHVDSSKKLKEMNLYQAAYFVDRELQFYEEVSLV
jgi:hypothetical protein